MFTFNVADHYWLGSDFVYSSKRDMKVSLDDTEYLDWLNAGGICSPYSTDKELIQILQNFGIRKTRNQVLEEAFLSILPNHLGQPYLTNQVLLNILQCKVAVKEANLIDDTGALAVLCIQGLVLPTEMDSDRQAIITLASSNTTSTIN